MRLTGHFLARDAFGQRHRPLPLARVMLYDRLAAMSQPGTGDSGGMNVFVRDTAARLDKEITDGYERQAVITEAASLLGVSGQTGHQDEGDEDGDSAHAQKVTPGLSYPPVLR